MGTSCIELYCLLLQMNICERCPPHHYEHYMDELFLPKLVIFIHRSNLYQQLQIQAALLGVTTQIVYQNL